MHSNQFRPSNPAIPLLPTPQYSGQSLLEQQQKLQQQQTQRTTLLSNPKAPLLGAPPDKPKTLLGDKPPDNYSNKTLLGSKPIQQEDLTPPGVSSSNRTLLGAKPNNSNVKTTKTLLQTPQTSGLNSSNINEDNQPKLTKTLLTTPVNDDHASKPTRTLLSAPIISNYSNNSMMIPSFVPAMPVANVPSNVTPMTSFMPPPPPFVQPPAFVPGPFLPSAAHPPPAPIFPVPTPPSSAPLMPGPAIQSLLDASSYNAMQATINPQTTNVSNTTPTSVPTSVISSAPVSYKPPSSDKSLEPSPPSLFPSASAATQQTSDKSNSSSEKKESTVDTKSSSDKSGAVGETGLEIAERKFKAILEEEKEFESSCSEWMKQYHTWLKDNENHPNKKQFDTYKSEWTGYIEKMEKKRKEINSKKSLLKADLEKAADEEKRKANAAATQKMKEEQFAMLKQKIDHFKALMKQDNLRMPESVINRLNAASIPNSSASPSRAASKDSGNKVNSKEQSAKKRRRSSSLSSGSSKSRSRSRSKSHRRSRKRSRSGSNSSGSSRGYSRRSRDRYRSRSRSRDRRQYRDYDDRYSERGRDYDYRVIPGTLPAQSAASSFDTGASEVIDYAHGRALGSRFVPGNKPHSFETWSPNSGSYSDYDGNHRYPQQEKDVYGTFYTSSGPRGAQPRPYRPGWEHPAMQRFPGRPPPGYSPRLMRPMPPHMRHRLPPPHLRPRFPPGMRPPPPLMRPPAPGHDWSEGYYDEGSYYGDPPVAPVDYVPRSVPPAQFSSQIHPSSVQYREEPRAPPPPPPPPCEVVPLEDLLYLPGREKRPENIFIIMRGLPGSGKTTMAKLIKEKELDNGGCAPRILNLDDFFIVDGAYEYDSSMKSEYEANLFKAFKRQIDQGYFPFIILDCVNSKCKDFEQYAKYAKSKDYTTYIIELELDAITCSHRNLHNWTLDDIKAMEKDWENIHSPYVKVNPSCLLKEIDIQEVEMEDVASMEEASQESCADVDNQDDDEDTEDIENIMKKFSASKWDHDTTQEKMERLDGLKKVVHHEDSSQNLSEYLQMEDDRTQELNSTGKKRVRWADLEELKHQMKRKQLGFVVGQTDWNKITSEDDEVANQALNRTKYFTSDGDNE